MFLYFALSSIILIMFLTIYLTLFPSSSKTHKNLPPSPWKLPIIGNLHQLGKNYHRSFWKLARKHGPIILMRLGNIHVVVVSTAHAAQEILKTNELIFLDRRVLGIIRKFTYDGKDIVLSEYGEYWRQLKGFVVLHLLSKQKIESFQRVIEEEMAVTIDKIGETCGSVVDFSELISLLSIDVMCRLALGRKYNSEKLITMVEKPRKLLVMVSIGQYIPWLSWIDELRGLNGKIEKFVNEIDEFVEDVIEKHSRSNTRESGVSKHEIVDQGQCFFDILLGKEKEAESGHNFSRETIKALIMDIFTGATDTTSTPLEWAFCELLRNPHVMKTLQKEVDLVAKGKPKITEDDIEKLEYLNVVIKENLRLHPPIAIIPRASSQDVKVMGYDIESGTRVFINVWAIGRDPAIWEEPEEFRPERFLDNSFGYKEPNFEFIPFGFGRRGCPGVHFATTLMKLTIANVVYKFDLALPGGEMGENLDMSESVAFTVHKKNHLILVPTRRSPTYG